MSKPFRAAITALSLSAVALTPVAGAMILAAPDAAYAKNGNGGGNGGGGSSKGSEKSSNKGGNKGGNSGSKSDKSASKGGNGKKFDLLDVIRGKGKPAEAGAQAKSAAPQKPAKPVKQAVKPAKPAQAKKAKPVKVVEKAPRPAARPQRPEAPELAPKMASNGSTASKLKWLNAAHASLQAYANASPDSRVGQIATYRAALLDYQGAAQDYALESTAWTEALSGFALEGTAEEDVTAAFDALQMLDADGAEYTEADIDAVLLGLNPDATEEELAALRTSLDGVVTADGGLTDLQILSEEALLLATDGLILEEDSAEWAQFHDLLRLDQPLPEKNEETAELGAEDEEEATEDGA